MANKFSRIITPQFPQADILIDENIGVLCVFIYDPNGNLDAKWQYAISKRIIQLGCLVMAAWGPKSTEWDDSVDWACLEKYNYDIPHDKLCMTWWDDDGSLGDAIEFFFNAQLVEENERNNIFLNFGKENSFGLIPKIYL